jgi:hypothetical protein
VADSACKAPRPAINTMNTHMVARSGQGVIVMMPPRRPLEDDEVLMFAAWLVAMVDPVDGDVDARFAEVLRAVRNT